MDRTLAGTQLCLEDLEGGLLAVPAPPGVGVAHCDEEELYRCEAGAVIDCRAHSVAARCVHGCVAPGLSLIGTPESTSRYVNPSDQPQGASAPALEESASVQREAAFAILCSH